MKFILTLLVLSVTLLAIGQTSQISPSCDTIYDIAEVMPYYNNGGMELDYSDQNNTKRAF
jgi:hypothetical protein